MNSLIDKKATLKLCREYTKSNAKSLRAADDIKRVEDKLQAVCAVAETDFRRRLARSLRGLGCSVMRCRVWHLINHGKSPVDVLPVASAKILVRKGIEVELDFIASEMNIEAELNKLKAAVSAFNS